MILNYMLNKLKKEIVLINDYSLSSVGTLRDEILEYTKNAKYNVIEDMVYGMQLTYDEIIVYPRPKK